MNSIKQETMELLKCDCGCSMLVDVYIGAIE